MSAIKLTPARAKLADLLAEYGAVEKLVLTDPDAALECGLLASLVRTQLQKCLEEIGDSDPESAVLFQRLMQQS
jgi:hypothetical protein